MRKILILALLAASGCATAPTQITTLTQAARLTNLTEQGGDAYVKTAHPSPATATTIQHLRADVRAAMDGLYVDALAGRTLVYSTLTAALAALNAAIASTPAAASAAS